MMKGALKLVFIYMFSGTKTNNLICLFSSLSYP